MAKSLTFWSIIIGLLLALDTAVVINLYGIFKQNGWGYAFSSPEYKLAIVLTFSAIFLLGMFFVIERDQSTKAQNAIKEMTEAINANMKDAIDKMTVDIIIKLESIRLAIAQSHNKEGDASPNKQANEQPVDKPIIVKKLDDRANNPQNKAENSNANHK